MLVSHDRYLIDKLTDQLFIFEGNSSIRIYSGNYTEYRNELEERKNSEKSQPKESFAINPEPIKDQKKKLSFKEEKEFETLEAQLPVLEKKIEQLTLEMSSGEAEIEKINSLSFEIQKLHNELDEKTYRWLELSELKD